MNSADAPCTTVVGSLADVSTCPTAVTNHCTLDRIHAVSEVNRSPRVALAIDVAAHEAGLSTHRRCFISARRVRS